MPDVPGMTLNSTPQWNAWLNQLFENQGVNRALPMFTYNGNVRPMQTPSLPGVQYGRPDMPARANTNINPAMPPPGQYSRLPPTLPSAVNSNVYRPPATVTPLGGGLPLMAPQMVGHPTGLRDREKAILSRFEDD